MSSCAHLYQSEEEALKDILLMTIIQDIYVHMYVYLHKSHLIDYKGTFLLHSSTLYEALNLNCPAQHCVIVLERIFIYTSTSMV